VVSQIPSHLAASWIALEDVNPNSGPLYYYKGSHKVKKFNFGNGIFFDGNSTKNPDDFALYLDAECKKLKLEKHDLIVKKGDVLIWHAALAHGGRAINDNHLTRKSFVSHYSSASAYTRHRLALNEEPRKIEYNGALVFANPTLKNEEDIFS
jgi:phytanoyl-CoA hydroxylase